MSNVLTPGRHDNKYQGLALSTSSSNTSLPRHRWFDFKEGFSEELVRRAIDSFPRRRAIHILDPFAGSGTSVVAAGRSGVAATAIEVNPFLRYAAAAKCTPPIVRAHPLQQLAYRMIEACDHELPSPLEGQSTFTRTRTITKWLFNRSVLRGYEAAAAVLARSRAEGASALRLALLASLMDCCNARRDGKCLRYRKNWRLLGLDSKRLAQCFERRSALVMEDLADSSFQACRLRVIEGDCRTVLHTLHPASVDLVVTSPPYLNSADYSDVYRPELFAGRFVSSNQHLRQIRLKTIRSHVQVSWSPCRDVAPSPLIPPIIRALRMRKLWDPRLPGMVASYFVDMAVVLSQLYRLVRRGGIAWIIVSTSAYAGIEIPVDLILADMAQRAGWQLDAVDTLRNLRGSGHYYLNHLPPGASLPLRESLLRLHRSI